jgi:hypothetical protein
VEFQIVRTTDARFPFFWRMVDGAGQMLTYSSARYRSCEECVDAVQEVRARIVETRVVDLTSGDGTG